MLFSIPALIPLTCVMMCFVSIEFCALVILLAGESRAEDRDLCILERIPGSCICWNAFVSC